MSLCRRSRTSTRSYTWSAAGWRSTTAASNGSTRTNNVVPLPVATLNALLLGPGTTVTHDAIKTAAVGQLLQCAGWGKIQPAVLCRWLFCPPQIPATCNSRSNLSANPEKSLEVARRMFARRFPDAELSGKTLERNDGHGGPSGTCALSAEGQGVPGWLERTHASRQANLN